jgi:hypothetical protein
MNYIKSIISNNPENERRISTENLNIKRFGNSPSSTINELNETIPDELKENIFNNVSYAKIRSFIETIETTGTLYRSSGHCIGVSDMIKKLLEGVGITSRLVECNLAILINDEEESVVRFIGYKDGEGINPELESPTHVVCITETEIPFLIDLSIYGMDKKVNFIFYPILKEFSDHKKNILTVKTKTTTFVYNERKTNTLIDLHEKSIIDRINTDLKLQNKINNINKVIIGLSAFIILNFVRGSYDFYQKYINKTNGFGPITHKVDK